MWILESDADFLQGKRMWLKPGKKYLFGRVKRDGVRFAIDHKTISRKHFVLTVDNVRPGDVTKVHARSRITVTDEKSKQGTFVDGELLKEDSRELTKPEHSIRPGAFQHELMIRWQPCVLTFSITKKEIKADALKTKRDRLQDLDVKVVVEYINDLTTHVVAGKRNTAKGLQALIQGKHIVSDAYVDALVYAATPADLGEEENLSPLEQDFDIAWPREKDHLPPAGKEPTARSVESYGPDPSRGKVFDGFTFIFGDLIQYENLLPAITLGQGKALLYKINNGQTTVDEMTQYMRNTAGHKGFGDVGREDENGGVILVRWNGKEAFTEWSQDLVNEVSLKLDQRAIDQAEFLDAILANDALSLRQTIPYESTTDGRAAPPPTAASFSTIRQTPRSPIRRASTNRHVASQGSPLSPREPTSKSAVQVLPPSTVPEPRTNVIVKTANDVPHDGTPPRKRFRLLGAPIPHFDDFDDGFDADSITSFPAGDYAESIPHDSQSQDMSRTHSHAYSREASLVHSTTVKDEVPSIRKRPHSSSPRQQHASSDDELDDLLPAATAMKRRKLALEDEGKTKGQGGRPKPTSAIPAIPDLNLKQRHKKRKEKELDVREALRTEREAEEEAARKEREDLAEGLGYENNQNQPAGLVVIVEMELPVREKRHTTATGGDSARWDPKWNGRKNFKTFKKSWPSARDQNGNPVAGKQARSGPRRTNASRVFVPLVEVKTNTYGIGEQYWDKPKENEEERRRRRNKTMPSRVQTQSQSQSQSLTRRREDTQGSQRAQAQTQTVNGSDDAESAEINRDEDVGAHNASHECENTSPATARLQEEAAAIVDHAINVDTPRRTRLADKTQSQNIRPQPRAGAKRPAVSTARGPGAKKQKTIAVEKVRGSDDSGDDSDDLKFRFRSKKATGRK